MKTRYMILSAASVIPLLSSCASQQSVADNQLWKIRPAYSVTHSTDTPDSYYLLGRYYQGQSRHEQALAAYRKALAKDPSHVQARNGIGVIYALQGRKQEAIEQFKLALEQAPGTVNIQNNLGYALYLNGAYGEAARVLEQAVALNPDNRQAQTNLALALEKAGLRVEEPTRIASQPNGAAPYTQPVQATAESPGLAPDSSGAPDVAPGPAPVLFGEELESKPITATPQVADAAEGKSIQPAVAESRVWAGAPVSKPFRIEVSNGNGVPDMARKVSGFLEKEGYAKARLTNQKPFAVASSQVQYREGYQAQARQLASALPGQPGIAPTASLRRDISVRVLLGKDMAGNVAYFEQGQEKVRLARSEAGN